MCEQFFYSKYAYRSTNLLLFIKSYFHFFYVFKLCFKSCFYLSYVFKLCLKLDELSLKKRLNKTTKSL